MTLPYPAMDFVPFDTLPAAELDKLVANIESLADGSGIDSNVITTDKLAVGTVTTTSSATNRTTTNTSFTGLTDSITLGAGKWELTLKTYLQITNASGAGRSVSVTLSSNASSETNPELTQTIGCSVDAVQFSSTERTSEVVTLTGNTTFTLMGKVSGTSTTLSVLGATQATIIKARKLSSETS